ncbi:MAG: hypothetical protein ACYC91_08615 [Solirubrobacteraceae bacterium]
MDNGPGFLRGDGELRARIRELEWSATALGSIPEWSQPLRISLSIEVWAEVWDIIGPMAQGVTERGESSYAEAQRLHLERAACAEETYFDFAYSPIHDDDGSVAGLLGVVSEITERVLAARRLETLSEIATRTSRLDSVADVQLEAIGALESDSRDLPFALLYEQTDAGRRLVAATGLTPQQERELRRDPGPGGFAPLAPVSNRCSPSARCSVSRIWPGWRSSRMVVPQPTRR